MTVQRAQGPTLRNLPFFMVREFIPKEIAMSQSISPTSMIATASVPQTTSSRRGSHSSWFDAMSEAWGKTLDAKAQEIETASDEMGDRGDNTPSQITKLTTLAQEMGFMSNSAHTSIEAVGSALDTIAPKQ
jgi:hypothetical protein